MRFLLPIVLLLSSCASGLPDFSRIGQLYRDDGGYGTASPVAYAADGFYVLTCWHVVRGDGVFTLFLDGKSYYGGLVTWTDEDSDTALVGFTSPDRPALYELSADRPKRYSRGYAAGYPLGITFMMVGDVLFQGGGVINHTSGPGGSGGPVFDAAGRVVGLVAMLRTPGVKPYGQAMFGWIIKMSPLGTVIEKIREL